MSIFERRRRQALRPNLGGDGGNKSKEFQSDRAEVPSIDDTLAAIDRALALPQTQERQQEDKGCIC